jgi:hypothetical protein
MAAGSGTRRPRIQHVMERLLCDNIAAIYRDELKRDVGALSVPTINQVAVALRIAPLI